MRVLITGASGFLGGHCAEAFVRGGHKVAALVRPASRTDFLKSLGVELRSSEVDMKGMDVVIHAAAKVDTYGPWREFVRDTIDRTRDVLHAASNAGVQHFIHISSRGVYERPTRDGIVYDESTPYGTPYRWSYYARAKIEAERAVREARIPTTILRPTWVYGPRDVNILPRIISTLRARRLKWIGDGENILNLVYATDAANAILLAATNPKARGQIYNVADDEHSVTQRQFLTSICELLHLPKPNASVSYRLAHALGFLSECVAHASGSRVQPPFSRLSVLLLGGTRRFSNQKLRTELGWQPTVRFQEGIRQAVLSI